MPDRDSLPITASYVRAELESLRVWVFEHFQGHEEAGKLAARLDDLARKVEQAPHVLTENDVREFARQEAHEVGKEGTDVRDYLIRLGSIAIAAATLVFVLRGGR